MYPYGTGFKTVDRMEHVVQGQEGGARRREDDGGGVDHHDVR